MSLRLQNHEFAFPAGVADGKTGSLNFPLHPGLSKRDLMALHIMAALSSCVAYSPGMDTDVFRDMAGKSVYAANYLLELCDLIDKEGNVK